MKKIIAKIMILAISIAPLGTLLPLAAHAQVAPNWDTTGSYVINMNYLGSDYAHDMSLAQDGLGSLTGNGGSPAGANVYMWTITSGAVAGDTIDFLADYTATPDAVTPQTTLHIVGTVAQDGTMSGVWSDNYNGTDRSGTWQSTSGNAIAMPEFVQVTIVKYIDGAMATAVTGNNSDFPMSATWSAQNIGAGTGTYALSAGSAPEYQAVTVDMTSGADYSTNEVLGGAVVGANCDASAYMLTGYSTGDTLEDAEAAPSTMTIPAFLGITSDKFVIVRNITCTDGNSEDDGSLGGDVVQDDGTLHVDSVTVTQSSATANGTFASGWKYVFHITAPTNEPKLGMKFADWLSGANIIPVANNMRISSAQADNGGATILLTAANVYSTPKLNIVSDLDAGVSGRQIDVLVEVSVPVGTPTGAYITSYGIQTTP